MNTIYRIRMESDGHTFEALGSSEEEVMGTFLNLIGRYAQKTGASPLWVASCFTYAEDAVEALQLGVGYLDGERL